MRGKERVRAWAFAVVSEFKRAARLSSTSLPYVALYLKEIQRGPIRDCAELRALARVARNTAEWLSEGGCLEQA